MKDDDRTVVEATNTHLYRGALLRSTVPADELRSAARALRVVFRDGEEVDAELLRDDAGDLAVDMPAHRTASGTEIGAKAWRASAITDAEGTALRIADRI